MKLSRENFHYCTTCSGEHNCTFHIQAHQGRRMSPNCCPPFSFHHSNPNPLIQSLRVRCPSPQPPSHPRPPPKQRESDGRDREAPARTSTHSHMCAHAHAHVHTHTHKDSRGTYMHPPSTQNDHTRQRQHAPAPPSSSSPSGAAPFACVLRPVHTRIPRRTTSPLWRHTSLRYVLRDCPRSSRSSWLTKASCRWSPIKLPR